MLNEEIAGLVGGLRSTSGSSLAAFSRMEERGARAGGRG